MNPLYTHNNSKKYKHKYNKYEYIFADKNITKYNEFVDELNYKIFEIKVVNLYNKYECVYKV